MSFGISLSHGLFLFHFLHVKGSFFIVYPCAVLALFISLPIYSHFLLVFNYPRTSQLKLIPTAEELLSSTYLALSLCIYYIWLTSRAFLICIFSLSSFSILIGDSGKKCHEIASEWVSKVGNNQEKKKDLGN